jgi:hypothetical protein
MLCNIKEGMGIRGAPKGNSTPCMICITYVHVERVFLEWQDERFLRVMSNIILSSDKWNAGRQETRRAPPVAEAALLSTHAAESGHQSRSSKSPSALGGSAGITSHQTTNEVFRVIGQMNIFALPSVKVGYRIFSGKVDILVGVVSIKCVFQSSVVRVFRHTRRGAFSLSHLFAVS